MLITQPNPLLSHLRKNALWLVMHPVQTNNYEQTQLYPWLSAETIRVSTKIAAYVEQVSHRAVVVPDWCRCIDVFSTWNNITQLSRLEAYMDEHRLKDIVYCGFAHGVCILSEKHVGMQAVASLGRYKLYLKHDLSWVGPCASKGDWLEADKQTARLATII